MATATTPQEVIDSLNDSALTDGSVVCHGTGAANVRPQPELPNVPARPMA